VNQRTAHNHSRPCVSVTTIKVLPVSTNCVFLIQHKQFLPETPLNHPVNQPTHHTKYPDNTHIYFQQQNHFLSETTLNHPVNEQTYHIKHPDNAHIQFQSAESLPVKNLVNHQVNNRSIIPRTRTTLISILVHQHFARTLPSTTYSTKDATKLISLQHVLLAQLHLLRRP
jgi:hypothetical protein